MKNALTLILSISVVCILGKPSIADDAPTSGASSSKKTDIEQVVEQTPSAITLGVVDGIIRYVNNEKRVKIRLQWEPMQPTPSLVERANESEFEATTLEISNRDIENGNWIHNIRDVKKIETLRMALGVTNLENLDFKNKELKDLDRSLKVSDYIQMQRERNILKVLLLSKGVQYSFGFKSKENPIYLPNFSSDNIKWQINIYSFKNEKGETQFYRFTAKAVVEPFEKKIPEDFVFADKDTMKKILYDVRFKLNKSERISNIAKILFSLPDGTSLVLPSEDPSKDLGTSMTEKQVRSSLTSLSSFFSFFGNSEQFGTVVQGILGGTENTSIVSGGLVGFKNGGVSALVGINQELGQISDDISGGILLGVGLGDKTSLFLGPSIRFSIFTLSAGATLGTQVNSEVNFAGMIAIDLSRFTSSKKDAPPIKVSGAAQGGGLSQISDAIIDKYTVVEYQSDRDISMTMVCNENSVLIPVEARKKPIIFSKVSEKTRKYVTRGFYEYKSADEKKVYYANYTNDKLIDKHQISSDGKGAKELPCTVAKASTSDKPSK
jgi:hypothetical protein